MEKKNQDWRAFLLRELPFVVVVFVVAWVLDDVFWYSGMEFLADLMWPIAFVFLFLRLRPKIKTLLKK